MILSQLRFKLIQRKKSPASNYECYLFLLFGKQKTRNCNHFRWHGIRQIDRQKQESDKDHQNPTHLCPLVSKMTLQVFPQSHGRLLTQFQLWSASIRSHRQHCLFSNFFVSLETSQRGREPKPHPSECRTAHLSRSQSTTRSGTSGVPSPPFSVIVFCRFQVVLCVLCGMYFVFLFHVLSSSSQDRKGLFNLASWTHSSHFFSVLFFKLPRFRSRVFISTLPLLSSFLSLLLLNCSVATVRVARLTLQTRKLWLVGVATDRDARRACLRFISCYVSCVFVVFRCFLCFSLFSLCFLGVPYFSLF